ncbi:MAG: glycosyltransferase [Firmicutes bacterium]|nr:glycosyltransferase [Bacillota bacterium]
MDHLWIVSDDDEARRMVQPVVGALRQRSVEVHETARPPRWPGRGIVWALGADVRGPRALTLLLAPTRAEVDRVGRQSPAAPVWVVESYAEDLGEARTMLPRIVPDACYPPGIDADVFGLTQAYHLEARPRIVYVGRYGDGTALTQAFNLARQLLVQDGELVLVDSQEVRAKLAPLVARLGLAERVVFLPRLPRLQIAALYLTADVIVAPEKDQTPVTHVSWAMASGIPVVAQHSARNVALLGDAALWIYDQDATAWRRGVDRALNDEGLREELARRALQRAAAWKASLSVPVWLRALAPDVLG